MENTIVSGIKRTFRFTLPGVAMLLFGGTALAATAPTVAPLKFEYTVTDANGNTKTLENKMTTGYEANRVAVDGNGNIYVTDSVSNTLSVFNTNGRLVKGFSVNRPFAVGADSSRGLVYVGGALNGTSSIFILDNNNDGKDDSGNLGTGWGQPMDMAITPSGNVYVVDASLNIVRKIDVQGATRDYGPFGGERYATTVVKDIYGRDTAFSRARHRMIFPQGVAVDETNGTLYVSIEERVEFLSTTCQATATGDSRGLDGSGSGTDTNCSSDAGENWKYYNDVLGVPTDSTYRYWNPIDVANYPDSAKFWILSIDVNTGTVKSEKILTGNGNSNAHIPRGLALDGRGRLYVATTCLGATCGGSVGGQIKVYNLDANPAADLGVISGFPAGIHTSVAFSPDLQAGAPKGRIFATMGDSNRVYSYSIDGGTNPANTAPGKPVLIEPVGSASVSTSTPVLKIKNAADPENDPLTYAYEIKNDSGAIVAGASGIAGGSNNETSMTVTQELPDSLYHWRTQSFDGEKAAWSDEAVFCVDVNNSNPTLSEVISPVNMAVVSPFASSLLWRASTDTDCSNDAITYDVTVSDSRGNILSSFTGLTATSLKISNISGLISGSAYNWTVRAVDSKGGKSEYSTGSFTYMTTSIRLDSDQAGTKVYMDGNYGYHGKLLGTAPVEKTGMAPGAHFVTFIKGGYEPHYAIINVSDPALDSTNSSAAYTAAMVSASRIKPATGGSIKDSSGSDINTAANSTPFVVDYNNDGVKDVIVGGGDGKVYFYLSEEQTVDGIKKVVPLVSKGALQANGADITVVSKAVPFMADYNNDGNQDLLVGSGGGKIHLYEGTANGFVDVGVLALKDSVGNDLAASNLAPAVVDYNDDGKKDLVVGSSDGAIRLYINNKSDESPEFGLPVAIKADGGDLNVGSDSKPFFADWNSDGKKDLIVGDGSGKASLFFNVGTDEAPDFRSISGLQQWIKEKKKERGNREFVPYLGYNQDPGDLAGGKFEASPFIVDWDGTSARDVVVGNGSGGVAAYITE